MRYLHGHGRRHPQPYVITDCGYDTPCWIYDGQPTRRYAVIKATSGFDGAHRVFYERFVGPIPEGYHIDHLCRQTRCIRPEHLEAVTPAANRQRAARRTRWTEEAVAVLIAENAQLSQAALGRKYGVSQATINFVLKRAGATPSQRLGNGPRP